MSPTTGILYVTSRLRNPPTITAETFNAWYETEHIPDVLATSAVNHAYRYNTASGEGEGVGEGGKWPYLSLYPATTTAFFHSQEYADVPVKSEKWFPGPTHMCFDAAGFWIRGYESVSGGERVEGGMVDGDGPMSELLVVEFDLPAEIAGLESGEKVLEWFTALYTHRASQRVRIYKHSTTLYQDGDQGSVPGYMALIEFDGAKDVYDVVVQEIQAKTRVRVARWDLKKAWG